MIRVYTLYTELEKSPEGDLLIDVTDRDMTDLFMFCDLISRSFFVSFIWLWWSCVRNDF